MTDADALLASILAYPEDDLPRLVYADWLDEQGNESDAARAAFIRVQCELAKLEHVTKPIIGGPILSDEFDVAADVFREWEVKKQLKKRERELLTPENTRRWLGKLDRFPTFFSEEKGYGWQLDGVAMWGQFRRGFIEAVRLPIAEFMGGGRCESCWVGEDGHAMRLVSECPFCNATGRTEGIAKRLFASQPIQSVIATDCHPVRIGSVWNWMQRRHEPESPHFVGQELFDLLDLPYAYVGDDRMDAKCAPSEKEAMGGLSRAMVRLGRSLANLRPLEPVV